MSAHGEAKLKAEFIDLQIWTMIILHINLTFPLPFSYYCSFFSSFFFPFMFIIISRKSFFLLNTLVINHLVFLQINNTPHVQVVQVETRIHYIYTVGENILNLT